MAVVRLLVDKKQDRLWGGATSHANHSNFSQSPPPSLSSSLRPRVELLAAFEICRPLGTSAGRVKASGDPNPGAVVA